MRYRIISVSGMTFKKTIEKLEREVNEAMDLGWEPVGGMVAVGSYYTQAMVKRH